MDPFEETQGMSSVPTGDPFDDTQAAMEDEINSDPRYQGSMKQHISDTMWNNMPIDRAEKAYEALGPVHVDPETGQSIIVPKPVPAPGRGLIQTGIGAVNSMINREPMPEPYMPASNDKFQQVTGMASNIAREGAKTALSAREMASGVDQNIEELEDNWAVYPTSGIAKAFQDIAPMIWGGKAGWNLAEKGLKTIPEVPRLIKESSSILGRTASTFKALSRQAVKTGGAGVGEVLAAPEDGGTLIFDGIEFGDNGRGAEILEDRLNLLADTTVTGLGLGAAANSSRVVAGFLNEAVYKRVIGITSKSAREEAFVNKILNDLVAVTGDMTSASEKELIKRDLITKIAQNKELVIEMADSGIKDIKITRDTMGALEYALANGGEEEAAKILIRARQLRQHALNQGVDDLENVIGLPDEAMDSLTGQVFENFGGNPAIVSGMKELQEQGLGEVNVFRKFKGNIEEGLDREVETLQTMLQNDPSFGDRFRELTNKSGIDIEITGDMTFQEIKTALSDGIQKVQGKSRELYDNIPEGTIVDPDLINDILANDNLKITPKIKKILEKSQGDYKVLHNELLPELRRMQSNALKSGDTQAIDTAEELRDFVYNDALDYVIDSSDEVTEEAAVAARDYYRDVVMPWRKGGLRNFYEGFNLSKVDEVEGAQKMETSLKKSLDEPVYAKQLTETLSEDYVKANPDLVRKYTLDRAYESVLDQLVSGKTVDEIDLNALLSKTSTSGRILRENFPEDLAKLESFAKSFQGKQANIKSLQAQLKTISARVKEEEDRILGGELGNFFKKELDGYTPKPDEDSFKVFSDLLRSGDGVTLDRLIARGQDNPTVNRAMKTAYIKHLREATSMAQTGVTGASRLDINVMKELLNKNDPLFAYGDKIFADEPIIPYATRRLLGESHTQALAARAPTATGQLNVNPSDFGKDARAISDFFITLIWGPLSRAGARVRTASSRSIATADRLQQSSAILDRIYADPDYFGEIAQRIVDKDALTAESGSIAGELAKWYLKTGVYSTVGWDLEEEDLPVLEDEFQKFFQEGGLEEPVGSDVNDQTDAALQDSFNGGTRPVREDRSVLDKLTGQDGGERFQTWPERALRDTWSAVRGAMSPEVGPDGLLTDVGIEQVIRGATEIGMDVTGASVGYHGLKGTIPDKNTLSVFVGEKSEKANINKLMDAQDMAKKGFDEKEILDKTGWFKGVDNKWRYEIIDADMKPARGMNFTNGTWTSQDGETFDLKNREIPLDSVIDHPQLFEAYPWLREVNMRTLDHNNGGGYYNDKGKVIGVSFYPNNSLENEQTLIHEIQHAIQFHESFAKGANVGGMKELYDEIMENFVSTSQRLGRAKKALAALPDNEDLKISVELLQDQFRRLDKKLTDMGSGPSAYLRSAGEVESRNVERRLPAERLERDLRSYSKGDSTDGFMMDRLPPRREGSSLLSHPMETQDTLPKNQIIQMPWEDSIFRMGGQDEYD